MNRIIKIKTMKLLNKDITQRLTVKLNKTIVPDAGGIMSFGKENDYPQIIEKLVNGSKTAKSCQRVYSNFLAGGGFIDSSLNDVVVGKDERGRNITLIKILKKVSQSLAMNNGTYIRVDRNLEGMSSNAQIVPFKMVRFSKPDSSGYSPFLLISNQWTKEEKTQYQFDKQTPVQIFPFSSNTDIVAAQIENVKIENYNGQLFHIFFDDTYFYPLSPFDPVYLDCDTENQISIYNNNEAREGFTKKTLLWFPDQSTEDEESELKGKVKSMMGADGDKVLVFTTEVDSATNELKKNQTFLKEEINSSIDVELYKELEKTVSNNIRKALTIPAILIDYEENKLSNVSGEAMKQAIEYYNMITENDRKQISESFKELFSTFVELKGKNFEIKSLSYGTVTQPIPTTGN